MADPAKQVVITDIGPRARFIYRGAPDLLGQAFGIPLPETPCRAATLADRAALWLGPDEWLCVAPEVERLSLRAAVMTAIGGRSAALVDVSQRSLALCIDGAAGVDVLAAGCPLDLDLSMFPVGMCTRTLFAKAEIVLWRQKPDTFYVEAWRSFMPYVKALLAEAARDIASEGGYRIGAIGNA
jgi:sarcosine oxidase, subunit gamma